MYIRLLLYTRVLFYTTKIGRPLDGRWMAVGRPWGGRWAAAEEKTNSWEIHLQIIRSNPGITCPQNAAAATGIAFSLRRTCALHACLSVCEGAPAIHAIMKGEGYLDAHW